MSMSFAYDIKTEICMNRPFLQRHKRALGYGLLLFGRAFSAEEISIRTEHRAVARLYADSITDLVGISGSITMREIKRANGRSVYLVTVDSISDRIAVMTFFGYKAAEDTRRIKPELLPEGETPAFLSGAFLSCGAISDPEKGYRAEFSAAYKPLCDDLASVLADCLAPPKQTVRRGDQLLYYKESELIEDLLTFVGATRSSLGMMQVKMVKDLRNRVNRETNCETANIDRTVEAAMNQGRDIRFIMQNGGLQALDEELRELAELRVQNPDWSLRELAEKLSLSRSGVNHRLRRIGEFAARLKGKEQKV